MSAKDKFVHTTVFIFSLILITFGVFGLVWSLYTYKGLNEMTLVVILVSTLFATVSIAVIVSGFLLHRLSNKMPAVTSARPKHKVVALLLATLLGVLGLYGMGHVYLGRDAKGLGFLVGGWLLRISGFICYLIISPLGIFLLFGSLILLLWQIFDANSLVIRYNKVVQETGSAPW